MSKYNLTDIFEQYQIGSGFTTDFDYEGMLRSGLKTGVDTDIEVLKKMSDDFEDVNYHRENNHLQNAIDALEEGAIKEASMFFGDFHAEIKATMETFDMDIEPTLGKFMDARMEAEEEKKLPMDENEEAVDLAIEVSQEKAGIKEDKYDDIVNADDDIPADKKKEAALAYRKVDKGASYKKSTSHIREVRIDRDVAERIEGMLSIPLKRKFLDSFMDLWQDLIEEDPFYAEDVINHLNNEMYKEIDGYQAVGDKLAGLEEDSIEEGYEDTKGKALYPILKAGANATGDEVEMYVKSLAKDIELNGKEQYSDFTSDDFVEDFKNYIADKSLQEHFKRFM
jgi:hypothetical protein